MRQHSRFRIVSAKRALLALVAGILLPAGASAHTAAGPALQAQEMLGQQIWSRVVKLENSDKRSRYPATLYATVFEYDDVLWFYTSTGTQPVEWSRGRVDDYRDNLLPLLRTIERGFSSMVVVPPLSEKPVDLPQLKNGCVIESIYMLGQLRGRGEPVQEAQLLLYSTRGHSRREVGGGPRGHAVLVFSTPEGKFVVDPPNIDVVRPLEGVGKWDPMDFAAAVEAPYGKPNIDSAFFVPVENPGILAGG